MVHADNCPLVEGAEDIFLLVAELGVVRGICWRRGPRRRDHLRRMLVPSARFYGQRHASVPTDVIRRRYH